MLYKFHRSLVGGTFDRFHAGHQKLLRTAFEQSEEVVIGITTDALFRHKADAHLIEDYATRERTIAQFLIENEFSKRSQTVPIHDFYGTSVTDKDLDAIFITESNKENVLKINEARQKKRFSSLEVIIVSYVKGNDGQTITSERIRRGEIDREGNSYIKLFTGQQQFVLPQNERGGLRQPIGTVFTYMQDVLNTFDKQTLFVAVGDIVAESLYELGKPAAVSVIDGRTRRQQVHTDISNSFPGLISRATDNPAGTITKEAATSLLAALRDYETTHAKQQIAVSGEEDLLAIPAILLAPLHAVVLYGQFSIGIIAVKATEQSKNHVYNLFRKFQ